MKKCFLPISVLCLFTFALASCGPDEPQVEWNKFTNAQFYTWDHGEVYLEVRCTSPTGPDCVGATSDIISNAFRSSFNTLKEYHQADDVPGFMQREDWRAVLPNLDNDVAEKLINREYSLKLWNPGDDIVTIVVQREPNDDYSTENVVYAFHTYTK